MLTGILLGVLEGFLWCFGKGTFVGQASHAFKDHYGKDVLLVESHFESWAVEDEVDDSCQIFFIFNEGEYVFAFACVYFLASSAAEIIEIGRFSIKVAVDSFLLFFAFGFSLPEHVEVFGDIFFNSGCLKVDKTKFKEIGWNIDIIFKYTGKDEVFKFSFIHFWFLHIDFPWKLNLNLNFASDNSSSQRLFSFKRIWLVLKRRSDIRQINSVELLFIVADCDVVSWMDLANCGHVWFGVQSLSFDHLLLSPKPFAFLKGLLGYHFQLHKLFGRNVAHGLFTQFGITMTQQYFSDILISMREISLQSLPKSIDNKVYLPMKETRLDSWPDSLDVTWFLSIYLKTKVLYCFSESTTTCTYEKLIVPIHPICSL